jgi:hypothetical protein
MHTEPLLTAKSGVRAAWGRIESLVTFTVVDMTPKRASLDLDFGPKVEAVWRGVQTQESPPRPMD